MNGNDGMPYALMGASPEGGDVSVYSKDINSNNDKLSAEKLTRLQRVRINALPNGGAIGLSNNDGKERASMIALSTGGHIKVYGNDNKERIKVGLTDDDHGYVEVLGKDSKGSAEISVNEYGGRVLVFGIGSDKGRAAMGVNEYGNGAIGTWDKHGYRTGNLP